MERTFVMIKPDGVQRGLIGEVISRIESRGLKIVAMKLIQVGEEMAKRHYKEHIGKPFYDGLISYITSGPVVCMVVEGDGAVSLLRSMAGATDPKKAAMGTIRGDFAVMIGRNIVHASDSIESAEREISIFFEENEVISYKKSTDEWVYEQ